MILEISKLDFLPPSLEHIGHCTIMKMIAIVIRSLPSKAQKPWNVGPASCQSEPDSMQPSIRYFSPQSTFCP